jgi:hypothetical protein
MVTHPSRLHPSLSAVLLSCALAALAACGGKKDTAGDGKKPAAPTLTESMTAADQKVGPAVRAALPEAWKGKLAFGASAHDGDRLVALTPRGWAADESKALRPPADADLGFMTALTVTTSCDGACEPKDWAAVAGRTEFAAFSGPDYTIVRDEKLVDGRLVIAKTVDRTYVVAARWKTGATRYASCRAVLDPEIAEAAPAFAAACAGVDVRSWD